MAGEKMAVAGYAELRRTLLGLERSGRLYYWLVDAQAMKPVSFLLNKYCRQVAEQGNLTLLRQWADFWRRGTKGKAQEARRDVMPGVRTMVPVRIVFADAQSVFAELGEAGRAKAFLLMYRQLQQYLREIQADGVDTKFMERDMLLTRSLWNTLNPDRVAANEAELRELWQTRQVETPSVGVRVLDEQLGWYGVTKFFLSVDEAAKCCLPVRRVFITENKVNGY